MSDSFKQIKSSDCLENTFESTDNLHNGSTQVELPIQNEPRRSERLRNKQSHNVSHQPFEPTTYNQAIKCPEKDKWILAMQEELQSLEDNNTWTLVDLPKERKTIGSKWVFKIKTDQNNIPTRYKARLVAQGFTQQYGVDYDEVFAPVARPATFRTLLAIAGKEKLIVHQFDVKTTFLNGVLNEEIYLRPPQGSQNTEQALKLHKSLYGLKQTARQWNQVLHECLIKLNVKKSKNDNCLYILSQSNDTIFLIFHVDDISMACKETKNIENITKEINKTFQIKHLGEINQFLGINVFKRADGIYEIITNLYK